MRPRRHAQHLRVELQVKRVGAELVAAVLKGVIGQGGSATRGGGSGALAAERVRAGASPGGDGRVGCVRGMAAVQARRGLFEDAAQALLLRGGVLRLCGVGVGEGVIGGCGGDLPHGLVTVDARRRSVGRPPSLQRVPDPHRGLPTSGKRPRDGARRLVMGTGGGGGGGGERGVRPPEVFAVARPPPPQPHQQREDSESSRAADCATNDDTHGRTTAFTVVLQLQVVRGCGRSGNASARNAYEALVGRRRGCIAGLRDAEAAGRHRRVGGGGGDAGRICVRREGVRQRGEAVGRAEILGRERRGA